MGSISLAELRSLRDRAEALNQHLVDDLRAFRQADPADPTFRRLPDSPPDFNVTTTCSCLMSLSLTNAAECFYPSKHEHEIRLAGDMVCANAWEDRKSVV